MGVHVPSHISARYQWARRMDGTQDRSGCGEGKKYFLPLPGIESRFIACPVRSLLNILNCSSLLWNIYFTILQQSSLQSVLQKVLPRNFIARRTEFYWLLSSPELTPPGGYFWGHLNESTFSCDPAPIYRRGQRDISNINCTYTFITWHSQGIWML
jgi:hypothetical protein